IFAERPDESRPIFKGCPDVGADVRAVLRRSNVAQEVGVRSRSTIPSVIRMSNMKRSLFMSLLSGVPLLSIFKRKPQRNGGGYTIHTQTVSGPLSCDGICVGLISASVEVLIDVDGRSHVTYVSAKVEDNNRPF